MMLFGGSLTLYILPGSKWVLCLLFILLEDTIVCEDLLNLHLTLLQFYFSLRSVFD